MDAFESAVAQVNGPSSEAGDGTPAESSSSSPSSASSPPRSGRGGRRPGAGRPRKNQSSQAHRAHSGPVADPPAPAAAAPEPRPEIKPIDPAAVAQVLKRIDQLMVALAKTDPVNEQDLKEGGVAFAPVFDHYAPQLLGSGEGAMWMAPTLWVVAIYGPRAMDAWERRKGGQRLESNAQEMPTASGGAPAGAGFSDSDARRALTLGYVATPGA